MKKGKKNSRGKVEVKVRERWLVACAQVFLYRTAKARSIIDPRPLDEQYRNPLGPRWAYWVNVMIECEIKAASEGFTLPHFSGLDDVPKYEFQTEDRLSKFISLYEVKRRSGRWVRPNKK